MQVFARTLGGQTVLLNVNASDTIGSARANDSFGDALVMFGGQKLEDGMTFGECNIQEGSTLHCTPVLRGGGDGTPAFGKRHKKTHGLCPRCNKRSFHFQKKRCASCAYPAKKMRSYEWSKKAKRRRTQGTGKMRHLKNMPRRAKNGFREGGTPRPRTKHEKHEK
mmetsp:Transcript_48477/g.105437  ORF Transcript_48477/g.105437 Transcript_48477/m.105437 type:complete len:165 (-) Transcript_48477:114-608(-)